MKSKVNWKPLGHSAKRWHGFALRKDSTPLLQASRLPRKKGSSAEPMWRYFGT